MRFIQNFVVLGAFFSGYASAFSFPERTSLPASPLVADTKDLLNYDFEGIVKLSDCSGSLVRFVDSKESDQAMVLTNGHCIDLLDPGVVLVNQASNETFGLLRSDASQVATLKASRLMFATMTKTDIGLYQLKETYEFIERQFGIAALTLSDVPPTIGTDIQVVSGYWKRGYECQVEAEIFQLREGAWTMENSLRYSRPGCETIGGTSGSPVIATGTRTVVAVNNTGNESGKRCTTNNPCEVDSKGGVTFEKGRSYAQQIYWLTQCRTEEGDFDLNVNGCVLPKPKR